MHHPKHGEQPTGNCEDQKEEIVLLKESRTAFVVIFMHMPKESMHDVLMREPGHELHEEKGGQNDRYGKKGIHLIGSSR